MTYKSGLRPYKHLTTAFRLCLVVLSLCSLRPDRFRKTPIVRELCGFLGFLFHREGLKPFRVSCDIWRVGYLLPGMQQFGWWRLVSNPGLTCRCPPPVVSGSQRWDRVLLPNTIEPAHCYLVVWPKNPVIFPPNPELHLRLMLSKDMIR